MPDFNAKIHKNRFRLGLRSRPELTALPRRPSWIKKGLLLREREERGGEGKGGGRGIGEGREGRGEKGKGKGEEGKGRECDPLVLLC